jgi:hypothetical protein
MKQIREKTGEDEFLNIESSKKNFKKLSKVGKVCKYNFIFSN